jgi:hypothetical protein
METNQANAIKARVAAREVAKQWLEVAESELAIMPPAGREAFFEELISLSQAALSKLRPQVEFDTAISGDVQQPMSDAAATSFGKGLMAHPPFDGQQIDSVPLRDLIRISEVRDTSFKKQLRRYLASPAIKALIEREGI